MQKLSNVFITFIFLLLLQACDSPTTPSVNTQKSSQSNIQTNTKIDEKTAVKIMYLTQTTSNDNGQLAGHYIYGHETEVFQPCNQTQAYWVTGPENILSKMVAEYEQLTSEPYEKVFVRLSADYIAKATDGFAMDYDGQVKINKLIEIRKSSKDDCN